MNPEKETLEYNSKIENECMENKELSCEEKRQLVETWGEVVLGRADNLLDTEAMKNEDVKKWLFSSLMREIEILAKEWKLEPDEDLIKKIQEEQDFDNKSKFEVEYIRVMYDKVSKITKNFDMSSFSVKWSSWPARMRETKEFNCVGATMLGMHFLKKAGIKSYYGSPVGHAVNIAELSNGEFWYADFIQDKKLTKKLNLSEKQSGNKQILELDYDDGKVKQIPLLENSEISSAILENFSDLKKESINQKIPIKNIKEQETADYIAKFKKQFSEVDFGGLNRKLYPVICALEETEEMKEEVECKKIAMAKSSDL